jgi:hypothetical protein
VSVCFLDDSVRNVVMLEAIFWSVEAVAAKGNILYADGIRQMVETEDNIGKMLTIDVETGEYVIDSNGVDGMVHLKNKRPVARLLVLRIGYDAAVGFGGLGDKLN